MAENGKCKKRSRKGKYTPAILKRNKVRKLKARVRKFPQDAQAAVDLKRWMLA